MAHDSAATVEPYHLAHSEQGAGSDHVFEGVGALGGAVDNGGAAADSGDVSFFFKNCLIFGPTVS